MDEIIVSKRLVDFCGDLIAAILLATIMREFNNNDGVVIKKGKKWIIRQRDEWYERCRISIHQYDRAIKILREKGCVETKIMKVDNDVKTHIRLL